MSFLDIIKKFTDKDISGFNDFKFKVGAEISVLMMFLIFALFCLFAYLSYRSVRI